ncbi:MAG: hypothetical protein QNJ78_09270 [Gammaproteobacteria bacterium]|nr:hypothetical protein [Gammaproteobacteria bacterium]
MTRLLPTLEEIVHNLSATPDEIIQRLAEDDTDLPLDMTLKLTTDQPFHEREQRWSEPVPEEIEKTPPSNESIEMPALLEEMIDQRIASHHQLSQDKPKPGQILRIEEVVGNQGEVLWEFAYPLAVLLEYPTDQSEIWHGWVVCHEVDYAAEWDVLLEEADRPCDPLAQMVQTWNPLEINISSTTVVLAELSEERLNAIRAMADEYELRPEPDTKRAVPGSIMDRYLGDLRLLTGTPLGGEDDPRWRYQSLYREVAGKINQACGSEATGSSLFDRLITQLIDAASTLGESLIPMPFVPQALGAKTSKTQVFQLEDILRLEVYPPPGDRTLQVRVEILGDHHLQASVSAGDLILQSEALGPAHPKADFFLTVDKQTLQLIDDMGKKRLEWTPQASD